MPFPKRPSATAATVFTALLLAGVIGFRSGLFDPLGTSFNAQLAPVCGDGRCEGAEPVTCVTVDCQCGDGRCDGPEKSGSQFFCPMDCGDTCGDGAFGWTEQCEDGNLRDGDGCSKDCKYECGDGVRDTNPSDGYSEVCDGEFGCVNECQFMEAGVSVTTPLEPYCKPFEPGFNDINADRVNVVFVGAGISGTGDLVNAIDISSKQISALEPFASAKDKLQFWYAPDIKPLGEGKDDYTKSCLQSCASDISCPELGKQYVNILCNRECLSHADFDGVAHISYPNLKENAGTFSHEFGHQFGELPDEYVKQEIGDWPKYPSCAPSLEKAREWWGKLAGKQDLLLGPVGYYRGCSYNDTNYRPDEGPGNVMWVGAPWFGYGELIHQPYIKRKLDTYSGFPPRAAKDTDDSEAAYEAWSGYDLHETAFRMQLERQSDGSYAILDSEVVEVPYGVKPAMQSGMAVSVTVDGKTYTQTFSSERISIEEEFSDPEEIHFGSFTQTPVQTITVDVGLGDTPPSIAPEKIKTAITPCNDNDESSANDCPVPMYRGAVVAASSSVSSWISISSSALSSSKSSDAAVASSSKTSFAVAVGESSSSEESSGQSSLTEESSSSSSRAAQSSSPDTLHAASDDPTINLALAALIVAIGVVAGGSLVSHLLKSKKA